MKRKHVTVLEKVLEGEKSVGSGVFFNLLLNDSWHALAS